MLEVEEERESVSMEGEIVAKVCAEAKGVKSAKVTQVAG